MEYDMKQGIIVYQSKYGATKKYAGWLREMTGFECTETRSARIEEAGQYGTLVLCGGIYASGIAGLSFLKKNMGRLKGSRIILFCVGASPYDEKALDEIRARNLRGDLQGIPLFYGRGAWDENKMTFRDRTLCRLLQKAVAKKDPATYEPWMQALVDAAGKSCDWTDRKYLTPLMNYLKEKDCILPKMPLY